MKTTVVTQRPTESGIETRINLVWAARDGRNPYGVMLAALDEEIARVEAAKEQPMLELDTLLDQASAECQVCQSFGRTCCRAHKQAAVR